MPQDLKFGKLREVVIPKPEVFTLKNGLKVFLLVDRELPLVSGSALVRVGNLFDPPDKRGLSELVGAVMRTGGTKTRTGEQLDVALEGMAASVETSIGETSGSVSFSCLKENTREVMALFKDVLTQPEFRADKFELARTQLRTGISRRNDDPEGIATREFLSLLYGRNTPWGWTIEYEHVDRIQRADLQAYHARYFFPKNTMLSLYGDFDAAEMKALLEKEFADWTVERPAVPAWPPVPAKPAPGVFLAEKEDVTQTFFEIGHLGGQLKDPDYAALQVAGNILGAGFSSRLVSRVRTQLGYAYSVGASWGAGYQSPGAFRISGSTKSASTVETIRAIREEVEKLRQAEVTDVELKEAKDAIANSFVFAFDRPSKTLNRLVTYEYWSYPNDFLFQYQKAVAAVTKADVLRVAKQHFLPERFTIVTVANPKELGKPLEDLKLPVEKIDLTIPEPKAASAPVSNASQEKGRALWAKAQAALGGAEKLAAVTDFTSMREVEFQMAGAKTKVKQSLMVLLPNQIRQEQEFPFGKLVVYSDGQGGFLQGPQGPMPFNAAITKQAAGEIFRSWPMLLRGAEGWQVNAVDEKTVEIRDSSGEQTRLVLDPSGLPLQQIYLSTQLAGAPSEIRENYSDWRDVQGIKLPFRIETEQGGKPFGTTLVMEWKLNAGATKEQLSKRP
jgi:zinc protease